VNESTTMKNKKVNYRKQSGRQHSWSLFTICSDADACPLSRISAEACFTGWPNARGCRDGGS